MYVSVFLKGSPVRFPANDLSGPVVNQRGNAQSYFKAFDIPYQISDPFYQGLAESRPLVNVIPAGNAKEAADNKLSGESPFREREALSPLDMWMRPQGPCASMRDYKNVKGSVSLV